MENEDLKKDNILENFSFYGIHKIKNMIWKYDFSRTKIQNRFYQIIGTTEVVLPKSHEITFLIEKLKLCCGMGKNLIKIIKSTKQSKNNER